MDKETIYQVRVDTTSAYGEMSFNTYEFTSREKAIECIESLYQTRFEKNSLLSTNPFGDYKKAVIETDVRDGKITEDGRVLGFILSDKYNSSTVDVTLSEKILDTTKETWFI